MFLTAQFIGVVGIFLNMFIYQQKNRRNLLLCKLLSDIASLASFLLLGAFSGAAIALIGCFRELTFLKYSKDSVTGKAMMGLFIIVSLICTAITYEDLTSILPAIASILSIIGFSQGNPRLSRIMSFPISLCMGSYSVVVASYTGVANEILTILSSAIGMIRYDIMKKASS